MILFIAIYTSVGLYQYFIVGEASVLTDLFERIVNYGGGKGIFLIFIGILIPIAPLFLLIFIILRRLIVGIRCVVKSSGAKSKEEK